MRTKLLENEKLIYVAKKHWILYVLGFIIASTIVLVFSVIKAIFWGVVIGLLVILYIFYERKTNIWIVTNKRFIDEWGIITNNAKQTSIDKINDITLKKDILGMILQYGDVSVQSAAEIGLISAKLVSHPEKLREAIIFAQKTLMEQSQEDRIPCPVCKELIKKNAIKCRFCGTELKDYEKTPQNKSTNYSIPPDIKENKEEENIDTFNRKVNIRRVYDKKDF